MGGLDGRSVFLCGCIEMEFSALGEHEVDITSSSSKSSSDSSVEPTVEGEASKPRWEDVYICMCFQREGGGTVAHCKEVTDRRARAQGQYEFIVKCL